MSIIMWARKERRKGDQSQQLTVFVRVAASGVFYLLATSIDTFVFSILFFLLIHEKRWPTNICVQARREWSRIGDTSLPVSIDLCSKKFSLSMSYGVSVAIYQSALLNFGAANMADYGGNSIAPSCCSHFRSSQPVLILNGMGQDRAGGSGETLIIVRSTLPRITSWLITTKRL